MAETVGLLILVGAGELGAPIGAAAAGFTFGATGISLATVVGTVAIIGVSIGLQFALNNPDPPKPENGSQALRQAIPPRIRGYGKCRLAGYYMCFEAAGSPPATSYDVVAFHSGRIDRIEQVFLSDDNVAMSGDINGEVQVSVLAYGDGRYNGAVLLEARLGLPGDFALSSFIGDPLISGIWTADHVGNGIAYCGMKCAGLSDPSVYSRLFPRGRPEPSFGVRATQCLDPRTGTTAFTRNPVLHLIHYLTTVDGGMGFDYASAIAPNLSDWINAANICDELVDIAGGGTEPRYQCGGFFAFDNAPENVVNNILATCDGWLAETGDGAFTITVGLYVPPTDPPLTEQHVFGFSLNYGTADEQLINQLDISYTDPAQLYVSVQAEPWRDEASISDTGEVRVKSLDLKWCQSHGQARRLADRAMQRLNPLMSGTFTTSLYGLRYLGKRWVPLQYPFVSGLQDCVVEIQDAQIDLGRGRIVWTFVRVSPGAIEAYDPDADQGTAPPIPPLALTRSYLREDSTVLARENASNLNRENT
jgi:hypothetical protein